MRLRSSKRNSKFSFREIHSKSGKKHHKTNRKSVNDDAKPRADAAIQMDCKTKQPIDEKSVETPEFDESRMEILVSTSTAVLYEPEICISSDDDDEEEVEDSDGSSSNLSLICDFCNCNCVSNSPVPPKEKKPETESIENCRNVDKKKPKRKKT